jgi:hypothetical protein
MPLLDQWGGATISRTTLIAPDVRLIELTPADGARPYEPGSHLKIRTPAGEQLGSRSYSLVGRPSATGSPSGSRPTAAAGRPGCTGWPSATRCRSPARPTTSR